MAVKPIYRQSWRKPNGWHVWADFVPAGGDASTYNNRTVIDIAGVIKKVSDHTGRFNKYPIGLPEAASCKFVIAYDKAPSAMKTALDSQAVVLSGSEAGYSGSPGYTAQAGFSQPNLFVIWSDRGTDTGQPTACTISAAGSNYTTASGLVATRVSPSIGSNLTVDVVAKVGWVTVPTLLTGGSGYSDTHGGASTGGSGSGATFDWTTSGGVITSIDSVAFGGNNYQVGDVLTLSGGSGGTLQVDGVDSTGAIASVTLHGGVNWEPGDTAALIFDGDGNAELTISTIVSPTYTPEFVGCQRVVPSEKFKETAVGLEVEIDAISAHKMALDWSVEPYKILQAIYTIQGTTYLTQALETQQFRYAQTFDSNNYIPRAVYGINHIRPEGTALRAWMLNMGVFWDAIEKITRERYNLLTGNSNFGSALIDFTPADVKFYQQDETVTRQPWAQGTQVNWADLYFIAGLTTQSDSRALETEANGIFGLLTADKEGITVKARTGWDLLRQASEQFFMKITPYSSTSGTRLLCNWRVTSPYGTSYSVDTISYNHGQGNEPEFERNRDRITGKAKAHFLVEEADLNEWESYAGGKSEEGYEIECIWNLDIQVQPNLGNSDTNGVSTSAGGYDVYQHYKAANLRGLYWRNGDNFKQVCARIDIRETPEAGFTADPAISAIDESVKAYDPNGGGWHKLLKALIDAQDAQVNFKRVVATYARLFGGDNNQTGYDMTPLMASWCLPEHLGHRVDVTPHSALSSIISEKAYIVEYNYNWGDEPGATFCKVKLLTRSIEND